MSNNSQDWMSDLPSAHRKGLLELANDMQRGGTERESPVRDVFSLLGDKWSTLILLVLNVGNLRHAELRRVVEALASEQSISQKMLTHKLRALERNGLVIRTSTDEIPPRVDYTLSPMGGDLVTHTRVLISWLLEHSADIETARVKFDNQS